MVTVKAFKDWRINSKIIGVAISVAVPFIVLFVFFLLPKVHEALFDSKEKSTRQLVDIAYNLMKEYDERIVKGEFSMQEGQKRYLDRINKMRYNGDDYFWVNDLTPRMVFHPIKKELNGKDLSDNKDPNGKLLFREMVKVCQESGEGYVEYEWPKPGHDKPVGKVSFVRLYKPWGWIVGTGLYLDDIEAQYDQFMATMVIGIVIVTVLAVVLSIVIARIITRPIYRGVEMMKELRQGQLGTRLRMDSKDEVGELAKNMDEFADSLQTNVVDVMRKISVGDLSPQIDISNPKDEIAPTLHQTIESLRGLVAEAEMLSQAAVEGRLGARGNAEKFGGGYRQIIGGVNDTLDAVIGPLNVAAEYVDRIAKGDIPQKITDNYNGDFNRIKNNLNLAVDAVSALVKDTAMLSKAAVNGQLATRADASNHQGDFRKIVQGVNDTLDSVIRPLNVAAEYVDRIAKGDIPAPITDTYNGDFNEIKNNLNMAIAAVNAMAADAALLAKAAVEGKLATRADAARHQGDFRKIVQGVNDTLDSVIGPLNVAAKYVDDISKGNIPPKITETYNGDFNTIKNNLNTCIDAVNALVADAGLLARAAQEGKLATRADASKHGGDFRKIVQGVNETLDSVIGPLNVAAKYVDDISKGNIPLKISDQYNGDFNAIKENLNTCIDAVNALVTDANMLAVAAVEGRLNTRADASKHQGDFRKVVQGVNDTLDAVILPVQEGAKILAKMSEGDLTVRVVGEYQGDHQLLKNSINTVGQSLNKALLDVTDAVEATASASSQISSSTEQMAAGSQEQSSQAGEVAAAVEEMTRTILENSKNALHTVETAKNAKHSAEQGGKVVKETVDGMKRIAFVVMRSAGTVQELGRSSEQIGEIVSVIDDIADQTNLLALNAAIEAARAGEQGRGFAVVADEVRKLAERTTKATKEIAVMIRKIQTDTSGAVESMEEGTQEVNNGITLADKAGTSLHEIVAISQTVTEMIAQIATASEQQTSTSEQISKNVEAISAVTAQTASGTQQVARAAEDLNRLTENLQQLVSKFTISNDAAAVSRKQAPRSKRSDGVLAAV
jgi:methyl-accepting chemotaxis protein